MAVCVCVELVANDPLLQMLLASVREGVLNFSVLCVPCGSHLALPSFVHIQPLRVGTRGSSKSEEQPFQDHFRDRLGSRLKRENIIPRCVIQSVLQL